MKTFAGLILAICLVFAIGATTMASPLLPVDQGQFVVYGDYDGWFRDYTVGAGYALTDAVTLGIFFDFYAGMGMFGKVSLGNFLLDTDIWLAAGFTGCATVSYLFDLDPVTLGVGLGCDLNNGGFYPYIKGEADVAITDNISVYGTLNYYVNGTYFLKLGAGFAF